MKTEYGLIGEKLGHSYSVPIHNMLGNNDYSLDEVTPDKLEDFIKLKKYNGINVTIPYKTDVMPMLDIISERALRIGSVNTVINRNGVLYGDNTDYFGFSYMARQSGILFNGKKVLILGTGGTSHTAKAVTEDEGAREIIIVGRTSKNNYNNLYLHYDADIIINTTPVGMYPHVDDSVIDLNNFTKVSGVIDVIYNPIRTNLILQALERGIPCTNGLPMLVAQAKLAHDLFFDIKTDNSVIDAITKKIEANKRNIVFIGMPGCGKTTLSNIIAQRHSMQLLDTDDMVVSSKAKTIPEIFEIYGEEYFRDLETEAVKKASLQNSVVIATGGGAILREENRKALRRNSVVIWLRTAIESLATDARPLSKDINTLRKMENIRNPLYKACADIIIDIDKSQTENNILNIEKMLSQ